MKKKKTTKKSKKKTNKKIESSQNNILVFTCLLIIIAVVASCSMLYSNYQEKKNEDIEKLITETTTTKKIDETKGKYKYKKDGELREYKIYLEELKGDTKYIFNLRDDFKIGLEVTEEEVNISWKLTVNDIYILDDALYGEPYLYMYIYGDNLIYLNKVEEENRNEHVYIIDKTGKIIKDIFELDTVSGMVPKEIKVKNNGINIIGTRTLKNDTNKINYNGSTYDLCNNLSWGSEINNEIIIEQNYFYKFKNKQIEIEPITSKSITLKDYVSDLTCQ